MAKYKGFKKVEKESPSTQPLWYLATKVDKRHRMDSEDWIKSGKWVKVKSSNVAEICYEKSTKRLHVKFLGGQQGYYNQVPPRIAEAMYNSSSMGKFVWRRLRDKFPWIK